MSKIFDYNFDNYPISTLDNKIQLPYPTPSVIDPERYIQHDAVHYSCSSPKEALKAIIYGFTECNFIWASCGADCIFKMTGAIMEEEDFCCCIPIRCRFH